MLKYRILVEGKDDYFHHDRDEFHEVEDLALEYLKDYADVKVTLFAWNRNGNPDNYSEIYEFERKRVEAQ